MTYNLNDFLRDIEPELERTVDEMILAQPAEDRPILMANRERIVREYARAVETHNLRHRVHELEERLRPRLVE